MLKVSHVIILDQSEHSSSSNDSQWKVLILSAATDGRVAFWDISRFYEYILKTKETKTMEGESDDDDPEPNSCDEREMALREKPELKPCFTLNLHQSGVNGLSIQKYGMYLLQ